MAIIIDTEKDNTDNLSNMAFTLIEGYIYTKHNNIYLSFSGGKESVVNAHLCAPWNDKVTLVWVNTGMYPKHMVEFVRGYQDRYRLIEIEAPHPKELWETMGTPSDLLSVPHVMGLESYRMMPANLCCERTQRQPRAAFESSLRDALYLTGVRKTDHPTYDTWGDRSMVALSETGTTLLQPLWDWTTEDVLAYVQRHNLELPIQYAAGVLDSMECAECPVGLDREHMAFLDDQYPETAASVRKLARANLEAAYGHARSVEYAIAPRDTVFVTPG